MDEPIKVMLFLRYVTIIFGALKWNKWKSHFTHIFGSHYMLGLQSPFFNAMYSYVTLTFRALSSLGHFQYTWTWSTWMMNVL